MKAANVKVPRGGSITVSLPFKRCGLRRIILSAPYNDLLLTYKGSPTIRCISMQSIYEISFESYFGYPDSSLFSLVNNGTIDADVTILADSVPIAPINIDYFDGV